MNETLCDGARVCVGQYLVSPLVTEVKSVRVVLFPPMRRWGNVFIGNAVGQRGELPEPSFMLAYA